MTIDLAKQALLFFYQEPKKYHVFNDIFRYQDETFEDTENEETIDGTVGKGEVMLFWQNIWTEKKNGEKI